MDSRELSRSAILAVLFRNLLITLVLGLSVHQGLARPEYFMRYRADPFSRPELKTCGVCHQDPQGGGPRNEFGQAFDRAGRQFTPALRAQFPDRFLKDRANLPNGLEIVFEEGPEGTLLVRQGSTTYRITPAQKNVVKVTEPVPAAASAAAPAPPTPVAAPEVRPPISPVFDYYLGDVRTGKITRKGELNFRFNHRFTSPIFNQNNRPFDLFGFDSYNYPGLGVGYGITDRVAVNVFRQAWERKLEFNGELAVLEQGKSRSPLTLLARAAIDGRNDFASEGNQGHYSPSLQIVLERTFANRLSINIDPTFVFRPGGLTPALEDHLIAVGLGGALRLRENLAITGEIIPRLTKNPLRNEGFHPEPTASFGLQFRTHRHVFQLVISNSWETNMAGSALGGPDEKHIGFNIYRRIR